MGQIPLDPANSLAPFPNNVIPATRFSKPSLKLLSDPNFPKPTPTPLIPIAGTYLNTVTNTNRTDKFDIRLDQNMSSKWRMFGRYSFSDLTIFRPAQFKGYAEGSFNDQFGTTATRGQNAVYG